MRKKILAVSDSHTNYGQLENIIKLESPIDYIIHCGDGSGDLFNIRLPERIRVVKVLGNIDLNRGYDFARTEFININSFKIMITHGDMYGVHNDYYEMIKTGKSEGADIIVFGHTHRQYLKKARPVLFNPGPANRGCYGIIILGDEAEFQLRKLDE